jgi:hypothetical protein
VTGAEFASVAVFEFVSVKAGTASVAGAGASSPTVSRTETPPCNAGSEIRNATIMKTVAATIVIFDSTEAVPRGPKAAEETLLVNKAPASVFPGCRRTDPTNVMQARKNIAYRTYNKFLFHPAETICGKTAALSN